MPKQESISQRILKLLNLEDEFEMSYEEYLRHLKEALVAARLSKSKFSTEEAQLLLDEFKRVKGRNGRFTINSVKEPSVNKNVPNSKKAIKFLTGTKKEDLKDVDNQEKKEVKNISILEKISLTVNSIYKEILKLNKAILNFNEYERIRNERNRRSRKESELEGGGKKFLSSVKKIASTFLSPFQEFWNKFIRFVVFTLLGRAFKSFLEWTSNPKNKDRLKTLGKFLKDFYPAIAGAFFLFATPFGKLVRVIVGTVAKLTLKIAKFAIPKLLSFIASNPLKAAAIAGGIGAYIATQQNIKNREKLNKEDDKSIVTPEEFTESRKSPNVKPQTPKSSQLLQESILQRGIPFKRGGVIPEEKLFPEIFKKRGVFSGLVTKNTGQKVSGYGSDTQYLPMENGSGGVVVKPGEIVMNEKQQAQLAADTGVDPRSYVPGPKTGKVAYKSGGIIGNDQQNNKILGRHKTAFNILKSKFPSAKPFHIAAALGNFETEAPGLKPDTYQMGGGPGRGIAQWETPGRWDTAVKKYGSDIINSLSKQLDFVKWEMNTGHPDDLGRPNLPWGNSTKREWLKSKNIHEATINFMKGYEAPGVPHKERRLNNAKMFLNIPKITQREAYKEKSPSSKTDSSRSNGMSGIFNKIRSFLPFQGGGMIKENTGIFNKIRSFLPFQGGGMIKENTGKDIPGATADRQLVTMRVQPGEYARIFTKDFVDRGGMKAVEYIQAKLDSDSNARKEGILSNSNINRYIPDPPMKENGGIQFIKLPTTQKNTNYNLNSGNYGNGDVPDINTVPPSSLFTRASIAEIYGILE